MAFLKLFFLLALSYTCISKRELRYTNTWAVKIDGDISSVKNIAERNGFNYKMKLYSNYHLFEHKDLPQISSHPSYTYTDGLCQEPIVKWFAQQIRQERALYDQAMSLSFNDPRWRDQMWYLNPPGGRGMNINKAWQQGVTGKGIVVAVVDDGLQQSHPDLEDNYDPSASFDLVDFDEIPDPMGNFSGHGNRCAGVIAASANNTECGVGVAFNARLGGIRIFGEEDDDSTDSMEALAFEYKRDYIDIYSCSWGPEDTGWDMEGPGELARGQLEEGTKTGRLGKGSIFVFAAGNGGRQYDSCAYNGYANNVFTITVSGVNKNGSIPGYAERCSAMMAATYSQDNERGDDSIITSDLDSTCSSTFEATSAATALASGIIALAMEVNPEVTWRDVQHLIAYSSNHDVPRSGDWMQNAAGLWVSSYFGFGLMDAAALVNYSRSWHTVPEQIKCEIPQPRVNRFIGQYGDTEVTLNVSKFNCNGENTIQYLEHVVVIIQARFDRRGYLEGYLTSPSGTTSQILPYRANDVIATDFNNWPILSLQFWGENPEGTWKLRFRNHFKAYKFSGYLFNWTLDLYGTVSDPLEKNPHVSRPSFTRTNVTTSTEAIPDIVAPVTRREGLTKTEVALISSAAVLGLVSVILTVAYCKFGICRRKSGADEPSDQVKFSALSRTSTEAERKESMQSV